MKVVLLLIQLLWISRPDCQPISSIQSLKVFHISISKLNGEWKVLVERCQRHYRFLWNNWISGRRSLEFPILRNKFEWLPKENIGCILRLNALYSHPEYFKMSLKLDSCKRKEQRIPKHISPNTFLFLLLCTWTGCRLYF